MKIEAKVGAKTIGSELIWIFFFFSFYFSVSKQSTSNWFKIVAQKEEEKTMETETEEWKKREEFNERPHTGRWKINSLGANKLTEWNERVPLDCGFGRYAWFVYFVRRHPRRRRTTNSLFSGAEQTHVCLCLSGFLFRSSSATTTTTSTLYATRTSIAHKPT